MKKLKKHRSKLVFLALFLLLLGGGFVLADYTLKDGTTVRYTGKDSSGNPTFDVTRSDGTIEKGITGYIDENGRGVPSTLSNRANEIKEMGGYGSPQGEYEKFVGTTPVYVDGEFLGYANVYDKPSQDGKGQGRSFLSDGKWAGELGEAYAKYFGNKDGGLTVRVDILKPDADLSKASFALNDDGTVSIVDSETGELIGTIGSGNTGPVVRYVSRPKSVEARSDNYYVLAYGEDDQDNTNSPSTVRSSQSLFNSEKGQDNTNSLSNDSFSDSLFVPQNNGSLDQNSVNHLTSNVQDIQNQKNNLYCYDLGTNQICVPYDKKETFNPKISPENEDDGRIRIPEPIPTHPELGL